MSEVVYVATSGSYSDYEVVGVFSTYKAARDAGDNPVFITTIDDPDGKVGAWECTMCESPTTAYYSAPAHKYKGTEKFVSGDVIDVEWKDGVPVDTEPGTAYSKTIKAFGRTKDAAIRAARDFLGLRKLAPWFANAWWPEYTYRQAPERPYTETGWAHLDRRKESVQAQGHDEAAALAAAIEKSGRPVYEQRFSSRTTAGLLPVFVRQDMPSTFKVGF